MKQIKLTGRERAVLRSLDFTTGNTGEELQNHTRIEPEDLVDIINGLMEVGYMEVAPYAEKTSLETYAASMFEVNPSYAQQLRAATARSF